MSVLARIDAIFYLLTPPLQLITGAGLVIALSLSAVRGIEFRPVAPLLLIAFMTLSFLPTLLALLIRARGFGGVVLALLLVFPYVVYAWIVFPVLLLGLVRQLGGHRSWAKTDREPLENVVTSVDSSGIPPIREA